MGLFRRAYTLFRIAGIPVRIHASWLFVFAILVFTLAESHAALYGAAGEIALPRAAVFAIAIVAALAFFGSLLLHELGHSLVALREGIEIRSITLFLFGGVAEMRREPDTPGAELKIALGGPAVSVALAVLFGGAWGVLLLFAAAASPALEAALLVPAGVAAHLAVANVTLVIFNAFPGFPLDGGRVLRAAIWWWTGSVRRATRVTTGIGGLFGLGLIALGAYQALGHGAVFAGVWLALIGLFVRAAAAGSYRQVVLRSGLAGLHVEDVMCPVLAPGALPPPDVPARPDATAPPPLVTPGMSALAALEAMRDRAYALVLEGDLVRGVVTRADILRTAAMRADAAAEGK